MRGIACLVIAWGLTMLTIYLFRKWFGKKKRK